MADECDVAQAYEEKSRERAIAQARKASYIAQGNAGDCDLCGEWSGRLIRGACAPCRDRYKLP